MDGEINYESDISESWTLIDINANDEPQSAATEVPFETEKNSSIPREPAISNEKELEDFVKKCKEVNQSDFSRVNDSDSDFSEKIQESDSELKKEPEKNSDEGKTDTESIEILDMDDRDGFQTSEVEHLGYATYQSDDEESIDETNNNNNNKESSSIVIKRKRRRISKSSDISVPSVNSCSKSPVKFKSKSKSCSSDCINKNEALLEGSSQPVYKHYRNNVANTVLSLSMGVIFAGVACIAIGHFLGVQDATKTSVELAETLKKLQMENAALHARLFHMNRALLAREANPKLELPVNENQKLSCEATPKTQESDLNKAALSEIRSSLNSIEWLIRVQNLVQKNNRGAEGETKNEFSGVGKYINDQLHSLHEKKDDGVKLLEDTDKISKVLKKIIKRLSSSHDSVDILYSKLIKVKDTLNEKLNKVLPELSKEIGEQVEKIPVREVDLQKIQWAPGSESSLVYNFPQPRGYYEMGNLDSKFNETEKVESGKIGKGKKKKKKRVSKKENVERKNDRPKDKKSKVKKEKRMKVKKEEIKVFVEKPRFNETKSNQKYSKDKTQRRVKNTKKSFKPTKEYLSVCSDSQCFNKTGHWVFKWANGREQSRKHQTLGDWQFERSKARMEGKNDYENNWQFERSKARREGKNDYENNWQLERGSARKEMRGYENENWHYKESRRRSDDNWFRSKGKKFNVKEFLNERFSNLWV